MKEPVYSDYIRFMEKQGYLEDVGSSDDLAEIMLNSTVAVLSEQFRRLGLDRDVLVDVAYDIINSLEGKFKYYVDCMVAQGFECAIYEVQEINEEISNQIKNKVNEETTK
jgi:hypothetical protein